MRLSSVYISAALVLVLGLASCSSKYADRAGDSDSRRPQVSGELYLGAPVQEVEKILGKPNRVLAAEPGRQVWEYYRIQTVASYISLRRIGGANPVKAIPVMRIKFYTDPANELGSDVPDGLFNVRVTLNQRGDVSGLIFEHLLY